MKTTILIAYLALACCTTPPPPAPVPPPTPDASDGGDVVPAACANLARWCPQQHDNCELVLRHAGEAGLVDLKPACLAGAQSKADVLRCGTVRCP